MVARTANGTLHQMVFGSLDLYMSTAGGSQQSSSNSQGLAHADPVPIRKGGQSSITCPFLSAYAGRHRGGAGSL